MESGISECSALQPLQDTMPGVTGHESNRLEKHLTYNMYMESTFCSFTEAGQQRQSREGLQFQWLKSELPMGECLKWKIPNIPVLTWLTSPGGIISMCDLSPVPSAEQLLPWHQSLGFTQPEEQQLQSSSKSRCQWESMRRQHKPCDPPGSSVTLKCSAGIRELRRSRPVPNS